MVEAYIGAVFVDSEFDYLQVERFFKMHIEWFFEDMSIYDTFANNHPTVSYPSFYAMRSCTLMKSRHTSTTFLP